MKIEILFVKHASPVSAISTAAGPQRILDAGLADRLVRSGHHVDVGEITAPAGGSPGVIGREFAVATAISERVRDARRHGRLPVVLSGSCHAALGCVAGLDVERPGIVWLDAHPDFNTPETTGSGLLDGMVLATITGRCWANLRSSVSGFEPVDDGPILMLGIRDLDAAEAELLDDSGITMLPPRDVRSDLSSTLGTLASRVGGTYVHLDLDVLDATEGKANAYATPGGLTADEVGHALSAVRRSCGMDVLTLASYEPGADPEGAVCDAAIRAVEAAVGNHP